MFFSLLEWPSCVPGHWFSGDDSNTPLGWVSKGTETRETPQEGGSAKAKAADSAVLDPASPAWPCRLGVGVSQAQLTMVCAELAQSMQQPRSATTPMEEWDSNQGRCHYHLTFTETVPPLVSRSHHMSQSR